ncbi:MAG: universal stress protein [Thermodesulfovibrionales bacterium]|nr:universal stress protein [Thermodesulfovibrionales bacterium]
MNVKKILFPTDFSEGSDNALPYAADMAKHYGAKLYLLHVIQDIAEAMGWYVPHVSLDELYRDIEGNAAKEIDRYGIEEFRGLKDIERIVVKGTPYKEILKFAGEKKADIIVIGTHGRKGLDRVIFGSTAEKVVRDAPCPVLSVRVPVHEVKK